MENNVLFFEIRLPVALPRYWNVVHNIHWEWGSMMGWIEYGKAFGLYGRDSN